MKSPASRPVSTDLDQRLRAYSIAAGAAGISLIALASPAAAQIVYTPVHETLANGTQDIDLNNDGIADFQLVDKGYYNTVNCNFCEQNLSVTGLGNAGAGVLGHLADAAALKPGAMIGPRGFFVNVQSAAGFMAGALNDSGSFLNIGGAFANQEQRFLGVRFEISGQTHYGWIRFARVTAKFDNNPQVIAVITGYAYESTANEPILAGATSGAVKAEGGSGSLGVLALGAVGLDLRQK